MPISNAPRPNPGVHRFQRPAHRVASVAKAELARKNEDVTALLRFSETA
jgi:hypothetical protein